MVGREGALIESIYGGDGVGWWEGSEVGGGIQGRGFGNCRWGEEIGCFEAIRGQCTLDIWESFACVGGGMPRSEQLGPCGLTCTWILFHSSMRWFSEDSGKRSSRLPKRMIDETDFCAFGISCTARSHKLP